MTVAVYGKPNCVQCDATYRNLRKKGIQYEPIDVTADPTAMDLITGLGYQQVPVVIVRNPDGTIADRWSGYQPPKLTALHQLLRTDSPT